MSNKTEKRKSLSTWKDIANYLDCDIRTCHRWEKKYELPIHRIEEGTSTRVFAYQDELDIWLENRPNIETVSANRANLSHIKKKFFYISVPAFIARLLIIYLVWLRTTQGSYPTSYRIENSPLIMTDGQGKELWKYSTKVENLIGEERYKEHFQYKRNSHDNARLLPYIMIKDLNSDGFPETLFSIHTTIVYGGGTVICFDHKGKELWSFDGGRELEIGGKTNTQDYRIHGFDTCDLNNDGNQELVIISDHTPDFPTQLVVLNCQGNIMDEFWNMNCIADLAFFDLDQDERKEIIAGAINDEFEKPCVFVLDISSIDGYSPQNDNRFKCDELRPGTEKFYLLFPKIEFISSEVLIQPIAKIYILKNSQISARTGISDVIYRFDRKLVP